MDELKTLEIPARNIDALNTKLVKMNNKAAKLGLDPIVLTTVEINHYPVYVKLNWECVRIYHELRDPSQLSLILEQGWELTSRIATYHTVLVEGNKPHVGGYTLIASIEHGAEGNYIRNASDKDVPLEFRTRQLCDHCKTNRRRNDTVLLQDTNGVYFQVGRNCLADFLSEITAQAFVEYLSWAGSMNRELSEEEEDYGNSNGSYDYSIDSVLCTAAAVIRDKGFLGSRKAREIEEKDGRNVIPTSSHVSFSLDAKKASDRVEILPEDIEMAKKTREWLTSLEAIENPPEYLYNLALISKNGTCSYRQLGLLVSAIIGYQKATGTLVAREKRDAQFANSQFVGEIGKRVELTLTYDGDQIIETDFGSSQLVRFHDENNNMFVWFNSGYRVTANEGEVLNVKGTIKGHKEFAGKKQTQLNRCDVCTAKELEQRKIAKAEAAAAKKAEKKAAKLAAKTLQEVS